MKKFDSPIIKLRFYEESFSRYNAGALARGDAAINLRFPHKGYREKIWDHVAGVVIATEAGAVISDASGTTCFFLQLLLLVRAYLV